MRLGLQRAILLIELFAQQDQFGDLALELLEWGIFHGIAAAGREWRQL